ncbi:hypothetical protein StoSoilB22_28500 [Arthrobacter sp. StoSoilB22]|nr:hypothetical protein StoSoilB22_28500 [Arthrobacter sp. StoSoilB22]
MAGQDLDDGRLTGVVVAEPDPVSCGRHKAVVWIRQMQEAFCRGYEDPIPVQADYAAGDGRFLAIRSGMGTEKVRGFVCEAVLHRPLHLF